MTSILYTFDRAFMRKTYEAIDRHVDADAGYLPLGPGAAGSSRTLSAVDPDDWESIDDAVEAVDPDVVVRNHRLKPGEFDFDRNRTVVHVRHGASIGRGEIEVTLEHLGDIVDVALAPGSRWAERYQEGFSEDVRVDVVGIPEADPLVREEPPREKRVLYAPTNHNYGGGSYLDTAEDVLDVFEGTDYELLFRPHPMDRIEEPGKSLTDRCRERIADMPNVRYDESETPIGSLLASDILVSDYSGIVSEWLHADRPLIQLGNLAADREVPAIGTVTDDLDIALVDELYQDGPPPDVRRRRAEFGADLGIPMDGQAGRRVADHLQACTE
jgi:hypothetical protein